MKKIFMLIGMFAFSSVIQAYDPIDNIQNTKYELTPVDVLSYEPIFDLDFTQFTGGHVIIDNTGAAFNSPGTIKQLKLTFDGMKDITFNNLISNNDESWHPYGVAKNAWIFRNVVAVVNEHSPDGSPEYTFELFSVPKIPDYGFNVRELPWEWKIAELIATSSDVTSRRLADRIVTNVEDERVTFNLYSRLSHIPHTSDADVELYVNWHGVGKGFNKLQLPAYFHNEAPLRQATTLKYDEVTGQLTVLVSSRDGFEHHDYFSFDVKQVIEGATGIPFSSQTVNVE